jgi:hypothetical protein
MEPQVITQETGAAAEWARPDGEWQERRPGRSRMFKPAHVAIGDAVHDCVLLDISPHGAQVHLRASMDLPEMMTLLLPNGESRPVRRCWRRGHLIGFEVVGSELMPATVH